LRNRRPALSRPECNAQRLGPRSLVERSFSGLIRPAGINSMGGYYTTRTQRVDMLDRVS
jgi:hypothetical protein